jgi:hypothetical protein
VVLDLVPWSVVRFCVGTPVGRVAFVVGNGGIAIEFCFASRMHC